MKCRQIYYRSFNSMDILTMNTKLLMLLSFLNNVYGQVQLTPKTSFVNENSSATLTCNYTGIGTVQIYRWFKFIGQPGGTDDVVLGIILSSKCQPFGMNVSDEYSYTCDSSHMTWTIVSFKKSDENTQWGCVVLILNTSQIFFSNGVYIKIRVPVTSIEITRPTTPTVTWRENTPQVFECRTSISRPTPTISWYLDDDTTTDKIITDQASQTPSPNDNVLKAVVGSLTYIPSRLVNGWQLYCSTQNMTSVRKLLNITYPPNSTRMDRYANGSHFFVFSGKQQTLTCRSIDGYPQPTLSWSCFNGSKIDSVTGATVLSRWTWTTNTGGQCTCTSAHLNGDQSYSLNVEILAMVSDVKFHISSTEVFGNVKVIHDSDIPIVCSASGTPTIMYKWQHGTDTLVTGEQLNLRSIQQDGTYTCIANNTLIPSQGLPQKHNTSSSVDITRLYPATPKIRYRNGNGPVINGQFKVVKGQTFSLHCHAASSPESTYTWNRANSHNDLLTIAGLMDDVQVKCTSTTIMIPTVGARTTQYRNKSVSIEVLKPPSKPSITYHYNSTTVRHDVESVKVIMGKSFNISCSSTGKPIPNVTWLSGKTSDTRTFVSITKDETGIYSCMAHNNMTTSFDGVVPGTSQNNISINVLYRPIVQDISDVTLVEGKSPDNPVICNVTPGNPSNMEIKWMRGNEEIISKNGQDTSLQLPLNTVNRNEDGTYECIAENRMDPTVGGTEAGKTSRQFKLTVYYNATITKFEVLDHHDATVMENEKTPFSCSSDSKPGSTVYIRKGHEDKVLKNETDTNKLEYTIPRTGCLDSGTYTCTGYNAEIGQVTRPFKDLRLNVKCGPRLSPINDTELNQTSSLNTTAVIQVFILAYPAPTVQQLVWKKNTNGTLTVVKDDRIKNLVSTSGIITSSSLEIQNVQRSDFGEYQLHVQHEIYNTNITIFFKPKDKPSPPTNVRSELVDTSSAGIRWSPGFDGGLSQTFIIMYKKNSESLWFNKSIDDTSEDQMYITLRGLDSGTSYTVRVYASNTLGNSSAAPDISFMTSAEIAPPSPPAALIGGAVGGSGVLIIIVVVVVVFLRRNNFFKGNSGSDVELDKRPVRANGDDDDDDDEDGMRANPMYISSGAIGAQGVAAGGASGGAAGDLYATPIKKKAKSPNAPPGGDIYAQVQKKEKPAKTNQKPKKGKAKEPKKEAQTGDVYENVQMKGEKGGTNESTYENPNMPGSSEQPKKKNVNKEGLIYADLAFDDQLKGQKKLVIIGSDDRTPYAQVDFTKKAEPLPESDEEK